MSTYNYVIQEHHMPSPSLGTDTSWKDTSCKNLRSISRATAGLSIGKRWPTSDRDTGTMQVRNALVSQIKITTGVRRTLPMQQQGKPN